MSWDTGVTMGHIASVTAVGDKAIAIEYDADMTGLIVRLKGNKVYNHFNESIASQIATVWQRMTLRTNTVFANAMPWAYTVQ